MRDDPRYGDRDGPLALSRRTVLHGTALAGALGLFSSSGLADGGGDVEEVVVRAEDVEVPFFAADADAVEELRAKAAEAQEPIVDYVAETDGLEVTNRFWLANALLLEVDGAEVDLDALRSLDGVSEVHANHAFELPGPAAGSTRDGADGATYGLNQINAPDAWGAFGTRGEGARIAVLDTGVDPDHPDLEIDPDDFAEFDGDGEEVDADPHDTGMHGTHVSGTVVGAEEPAGDVPSYGVAPEATLMHGLVLPGGGGTFAQIIGGMEWAVENDADAINMSLGAGGYHGEMIEPIRNAEAAGTLVIAASGNDGAGTSGSPGNVHDSLAVGASDENEAIADFSSGETIDTETAWGVLAPSEWPDEYVVPDVSAPGVDVLSAIPVDYADDEYDAVSGTSMASPHVAGLLALMQSAAEDAFDPSQAKAALTTTGWKPADESDGQDTRYGHGIVDALHATSRVAAESGVEGTVADGDGDPIAGATVELDGFPTETDADGAYTLRALAGTYEVTADAFGYAPVTATVDVSDDQFTGHDLTLDDALAARLIADQPAGLEAGESFEVELGVANADALTVSIEGDYEGGAALAIDGDEEARFDEAYDFDGVETGTVTVSVSTDEKGLGDLELRHAFEGLGETVEVTTGPTSVFDQPVPIGVVDVEGGGFTADVVAMLDEEMHPRYQFEALTPADALDAVPDREHEAYVVQNLGVDEDVIEDFAAETADPAIGVVYLDQFEADSNAVSQLSEATGDPRHTVDAYFQGIVPPVEYRIGQDHPIIEGVADVDEAVPITEPPGIADPFVGVFGGFHTYFEEYAGAVAGATIAETEASFQTTGGGLGVDDLSRTVLASSLGLGFFVGRNDVTASGREILGNAVSHAASAPAIRVAEMPPERIAPGETATIVVDADDLLEVEIGVSGLEFLAADDLTLRVDGEEAAFDEPIAFDEPRDGELEIAVETPDAIGRFAPDGRFVTLGDRDEDVETAVTFRPTRVYESPIRVPEQIDDLQGAVDFVAPGDEVVLADGTYEVDEPDRGFQAGLYVGTEGITLRAADGATPEIVHARDLPAPNVVNVDADDVTIEGIHANVVDGAVDEKNAIANGVRVDDLTTGVTVRDVTASGTSGVFLDANVSDVAVEGGTMLDTSIGVGTDLTGGPVENVRVTGVTIGEPSELIGWGGVYLNNADGVTVTDCEIAYGENYDGGVVAWGAFTTTEESRIENNAIVGVGTDEPLLDDWENGIFVDDLDVEIRDNEIEDVHVGIRVGDFGFGDGDVVVEGNAISNADTGYRQTGDYATLELNDVAAETGLDFDGGFFGLDADAVLARYNDLSGTDLPFQGDPGDGFGAPEGPFDCRENYLGDRDYDETIADGDVEYDPFLTVPPAELDASADAAGADVAAPTEIGTDLYLQAGETYGLGIPGPSDLTIWDVLGVDGGHEAFAGEVHAWNEGTESWQPVTGRGKLSDQNTLTGFKVIPAEDRRAVMHFQYREDAEDAPPGRRDSDLGVTEVEEGTNIVCAPSFLGDEDFEGTAEIESIEPGDLHAPGSQLGERLIEDEAEKVKKPFNAYYVECTEPGTIVCNLDAYDPTTAELCEALGVDPVIHDSPGAGASASELDVDAADVVDAAEDDETARDAVVSLVVKRIASEIGPEAGDDPETIVDAIEGVAGRTADEAPASDEELVENAVGEAVGAAVRSLFGAEHLSDGNESDVEYDAAATFEAAEADD
ncbi:S8 family serine peptidase [Halovivax sp.]|uniref:S8 family serine peptidase n=1 Tax=Halovivax sp. TaxID=1935978 RepID=UPI0025C33301|nr:S8 family serine peptidase [Halovivax sp.]